jgi:chaperonin GroEL
MTLLAQKQINTLVIIADNVETSALATLIVNKMQGKFMAVAVNAPLQGELRTSFLEDLAIMTGGKVFSEKKGDKLANAVLEDLGRADRFIAGDKQSVVVGPRGKKASINSAVAALNTAITTAKDPSEAERYRQRLARMSNKIGVIRVGAATEQEERALRYKVDDAVHAVQAAYKGGVVPGGGMALASINTSSEILNEALFAPHKQLCDNVGVETRWDLEPGHAVNVVTGKTGPFMQVGVMDPVDVLIAGVESAISIASMLLTASGMIVEPPPKPRTE